MVFMFIKFFDLFLFSKIPKKNFFEFFLIGIIIKKQIG